MFELQKMKLNTKQILKKGKNQKKQQWSVYCKITIVPLTIPYMKEIEVNFWVAQKYSIFAKNKILSLNKT